MAEDTGGERTEKATGRRREKAREKGQVAKSQEVNGALLLLVGMAALLASAGHFGRVLGENAGYLLSQAHVLGEAAPAGAVGLLLAGNLEVFGAALAPLVVALLIAAFGANVMQVGFRITPQAMAFKAERLDPVQGMKRFFKKTALFELLKNVLKITVVSLLAWWIIRGLFGDLLAAPLLPVPEIVAVGRGGFMKLMAVLLLFAALVAVVDWFWQRHQHEENLKMSKYEVKQEHKELEGDPQIKARIRSLQFEMARKRMLADVPTADVVLTNPTHFAVALRYETGAAAPVVVAKGRDHVAETIKRIARQARVPVIENKPLARALFKQVDLGRMIPEALYQAVAEVLAYVYRLKTS